MQFYLNPEREQEANALPDAETFLIDEPQSGNDASEQSLANGWHWWPCFPGCLPDGDPIGPFDTAALAIADAQGGAS